MHLSIVIPLGLLLVFTQTSVGRRGRDRGSNYYGGYNTGYRRPNRYPYQNYYGGYYYPQEKPQAYYYYYYEPPRPEFPTELYNDLPDYALDESLCYLLGNIDFFGLMKKLLAKGLSFSKIYDVFEIIEELQSADFKEGLLNLAETVFERLSDAGKQRYCHLLSNMPNKYRTCGYRRLIALMKQECETPTGTTANPSTAAPTTRTTAAFTTTTAEATTTTTTTTSTTTTTAAPTDAPTTTAAPTDAPTTTAPTPLDCNDITTIRDVAVQTRIVGGVAAQQGDWESFASLKLDNSLNPVCGATIIDACTIMTAAHCIDGISADRLTVQVGDHTTVGGTTSFDVNQVLPHADYNNITTVNDIAILKIDPIDFNSISNTAPACLATADLDLTGVNCTAIGAGTTSFGGQQPEGYLLQQVDVPTNDGNTCAQSSGILVTMTDPDNQICAGEAGKDSCQGDSGGPLNCKQNGLDVVAGVVSYGVNCGLDGYPGVYAKVSSYADWIEARSGC